MTRMYWFWRNHQLVGVTDPHIIALLLLQQWGFCITYSLQNDLLHWNRCTALQDPNRSVYSGETSRQNGKFWGSLRLHSSHTEITTIKGKKIFFYIVQKWFRITYARLQGRKQAYGWKHSGVFWLAHSVMLTNIVIHISIYSSVYPQECQGVLDSLHK